MIKKFNLIIFILEPLFQREICEILFCLVIYLFIFVVLNATIFHCMLASHRKKIFTSNIISPA